MLVPTLTIALAALCGVALGLWLRRDLATLGYRNQEEQALPHPGPRWWVVCTSAMALGTVAAAAILSQDPPRYAPLLPLAVAGPWLAAVDLDVLRIPNQVLVPVAAASLLAIVSIAAAAQDWRTVLVPIVAAWVNTAVFAAVHFATKGGIGFGDVKLAAVIGMAVGPLGVGAVWLSVLVGSVLALVWHITTRKATPIPYGPWLLAGTWLCACLPPLG